MITTNALFSNRIRPVGDILSGLERALCNLPSLVSWAMPPTIAYAALMTIGNAVMATQALPHYVASRNSQFEWWASSLIYSPFCTLIIYGMLRCLWFSTRSQVALFARVTPSIYGLGFAWMAGTWFAARLGLFLQEQIYAAYARVDDINSMVGDIALVRLFETSVFVLVAAIGMTAFSCATLVSPRASPKQRATIVGLIATTAIALLAAILLKFGLYFLPDGEPQPGWELAANGAALLATIALIAASTNGWGSPIGSLITHAGWRFTSLALIAGALAHATGYLFDYVLGFVGFLDIRIDDAHLRSEFAVRAFVHHGLIGVRDFFFCFVLAGIVAEGFRRILGQDLVER